MQMLTKFFWKLESSQRPVMKTLLPMELETDQSSAP